MESTAEALKTWLGHAKGVDWAVYIDAVSQVRFVHHAQQHGRSDTRTIQRQRNRNSQPAKKMTTSLSIDIGTSARRMEADALQPLFPDLNPLYLNLSTETAQPKAQKSKER